MKTDTAKQIVKTRSLGQTGIRVSELGFGTWGLSGTSYGPVDDDESVAALQKAVDLGITFFDTADLYGDGHSEEIVGRTLRPHRDKVAIATKGGSLPHTGFYMPQDFSPAYLRSALEKSLQRLNTEYVDLYQLHSPAIDGLNWDQIFSCLQDFRDEGKIKAFGVSVRGPKDAVWLVQNYPVQVIQANFNLIDHRVIETGLLELARSKSVGIIARTPLCFGFLSGTVDENTEFAESDHRKLWPKEQIRRWVQAVNLFQPIYESKNQTAVDLALRFCLSFDAISTVIPGMITTTEVEDNVNSALLGSLDQSDLESIFDIYARTQFYDPGVKAAALKGT